MVSSEVPLLSPCPWNCGSNTSTLRYSLLDIKVTPYRGTTQPATVVRVQIQPRDPISGRQHDTQLQLCVPQVSTRWAWWSSRSTVAVARVLGMMVSKPEGWMLLVTATERRS